MAAEGLLDSISAGILIYMALVDLIAADVLDRLKNCSIALQVGSYAALFLGAGLMSVGLVGLNYTPCWTCRKTQALWAC